MILPASDTDPSLENTNDSSPQINSKHSSLLSEIRPSLNSIVEQPPNDVEEITMDNDEQQPTNTNKQTVKQAGKQNNTHRYVFFLS